MKLPSSGPNAVRLFLLALIAAGAAAFLLAGGYRFLSFDQLVAHKDALMVWADARPLLAPAVWVAAYLVLGLFGLPGSTVMNLSAGLLFEFWRGLLLVIAGSTLASIVAFLSFRYLLRDFVEERARRRFPHLLEGLEREGVYFVLTLRLLPVIPFSATNVILAISPVRFAPFLFFSLLGLLPRYVLYVYAGAHLGDVENPDDLWSLPLLGALSVLAVLPWLVRGVRRRMTHGSGRSR
ncbi:MAG TPA: VTT domain-containing protein [Thermoanaerobaculia bacterium]|nr:VTT domain-containing protein [Thermoanaerobaculia bacterium]